MAVTGRRAPSDQALARRDDDLFGLSKMPARRTKLGIDRLGTRLAGRFFTPRAELLANNTSSGLGGLPMDDADGAVKAQDGRTCLPATIATRASVIEEISSSGSTAIVESAGRIQAPHAGLSEPITDTWLGMSMPASSKAPISGICTAIACSADRFRCRRCVWH